MGDWTHKGLADLESLSLSEVIRGWDRMAWWTAIRPMFRRMLEVDLTLAESIVLRTLQHHPLTVAEVADCLYISHSAASRAVDRLVHDGFVSRQENPEDRRQKQLTLTPQGEALVGEMESLYAERLEPVIASLSAEDREQLRVLMARMVAAWAARHADLAVADEAGRCPVFRAKKDMLLAVRRRDE